MGEEKRRYIRWAKKIRVAYALTEGDESYKEIFTEDLSDRGLQILVAGRLGPGQTVRLKLEFIYDSVPIMAVGRVTYVRDYEGQYRVGLEFINMSDFQKQRLKRSLDKVRQDFRDEAKEGYAKQEG